MGFSLEEFFKELEFILNHEKTTEREKIHQAVIVLNEAKIYAKECGMIKPTCERCGTQEGLISNWLVKNLCNSCKIIKENR